MPLKTHIDEQPTLNLTPMIDVVFLLIVFFMVGTKFTELERKIGLRVPEVTNVEALTPAPEPRVVNVFADGQLTLDRQPVASLEQLTQELAAAKGEYRELGVLVRGDADGRFPPPGPAARRAVGVGQCGCAWGWAGIGIQRGRSRALNVKAIWSFPGGFAPEVVRL